MKMAAILATCGVLACGPAQASKTWVYEFEFGHQLQSSSSRLYSPTCSKVVPVELVNWYMFDRRPGWEISCGNRQPVYNHFFGRSIGQPLPNLRIELGWRHMSSPADHNELEYDAIAVRGRFEFGRSR